MSDPEQVRVILAGRARTEKGRGGGGGVNLVAGGRRSPLGPGTVNWIGEAGMSWFIRAGA